MSEQGRTYIPTPLEDNLRKWIEAALATDTQFADVLVGFGNQGNYRGQKPLVEIVVLTDEERETPREVLTGNVLTDGTYEACLVAPSAGTVQITSYGERSWLISKAISRSLWNQDVIQTNSSNGIEVQQAISPINNLPNPLSTTTEQRRQQDFQFAYTEVTTLAQGRKVLERAIVTGDIYIDTPGDGVDVDVDESWPTP
jgi:hypothetical protein